MHSKSSARTAPSSSLDSELLSSPISNSGSATPAVASTAIRHGPPSSDGGESSRGNPVDMKLLFWLIACVKPTKQTRTGNPAIAFIKHWFIRLVLFSGVLMLPYEVVYSDDAIVPPGAVGVRYGNIVAQLLALQMMNGAHTYECAWSEASSLVWYQSLQRIIVPPSTQVAINTAGMVTFAMTLVGVPGAMAMLLIRRWLQTNAMPSFGFVYVCMVVCPVVLAVANVFAYGFFVALIVERAKVANITSNVLIGREGLTSRPSESPSFEGVVLSQIAELDTESLPAFFRGANGRVFVSTVLLWAAFVVIVIVGLVQARFTDPEVIAIAWTLVALFAGIVFGSLLGPAYLNVECNKLIAAINTLHYNAVSITVDDDVCGPSPRTLKRASLETLQSLHFSPAYDASKCESWDLASVDDLVRVHALSEYVRDANGQHGIGVVLIGIRLNFHQLKLIASLVFSFFASRITSIVSEELLTTLGNATAASPNSSGLFSGL